MLCKKLVKLHPATLYSAMRQDSLSFDCSHDHDSSPPRKIGKWEFDHP